MVPVNPWSVFHLPKNFGNSGWDVNGTRHFGSFHWKFSGINGIPEKVVPFSRWKLLNGKFVFHLQISRLYRQFHAFRGLLSGNASLGSLVFQQKWRLIRVSFLEAFCGNKLSGLLRVLRLPRWSSKWMPLWHSSCSLEDSTQTFHCASCHRVNIQATRVQNSLQFVANFVSWTSMPLKRYLLHHLLN